MRRQTGLSASLANPVGISCELCQFTVEFALTQCAVWHLLAGSCKPAQRIGIEPLQQLRQQAAGQRAARGQVGQKGFVVEQGLGVALQVHAQTVAQQVAARVAEELGQLHQRHLTPVRAWR